MRLQDELLALYPIGGGSVRQYILGQVPSLPIHFDSGALEDLLDRARTDTDPKLVAHALGAWNRGGPDLVAYAYGLAEERLGLWSTLAAQARAVAVPGDEDGTDDTPAPGQRAALAPLLEPCRAKILSAAEKSGTAGDLAREVLGLVPLDGGDVVLRSAAHDPSRAVSALLALARCDRAMAARALTSEKLLPLWIRAFAARAIGGVEAAAVCQEAVRHGDETSRWGAAMAIPALPPDAWQPIAKGLMAAEGGWVRVLVMDALGELARCAMDSAQAGRSVEDLLRLLDRGLKEAAHDMIRTAAVRAMAWIRHDLPVRRARRCLERGSVTLQIAAIEALTRMGHDDPQVRAMLTGRLQAQPWRLCAAAALGLMRYDPDHAMQASVTLVRSSESTARLEGACCLGYLQCQTSLDLLAILARADRFLPSALQAQRSLAHFPEAEAAPILMRLLDHTDAPIALCAAGVLTHFPGERQTDLVDALTKLAQRLAPGDRRALLRQAGRSSPAVPGMEEFLSREQPDAAGEAGALEGLARAGVGGGRRAARAAQSSERALAIPGAMAQVLGGDAAGVDALARCLADPDGAVEALAALRTLAVLAGEAGRGGRHKALRALMGVRQRSKAMPLPASGPIASVAPWRGPRIVAGPVRADDSPEKLRRAVGLDRAALAQDLATTLAGTDRATARQARSAWPLEITSIQDAGLAVLAGAQSLAWLPAPVRPYAALLLVPLAILIPVCIALSHMPARVSTGGSGGRASPLDPGHLRVIQLKGTAHIIAGQAPIAPLALHQVVAPGDQVSTGPDSRLVLSGGSGKSLWLSESSELRVGVARTEATTPSLVSEVFTDVRGDVLIDWRKGKAFEVILGQDHIACGAVTLRVLDSGADRTLSVAAGEAVLLAGGSPPRRVMPGQPVTLPAR